MKQYIAIDLKSFYASVECVSRGLDPLHTNLVVADERRTKKTICLAVSPALKAYGIPGRARLFEVVEKVAQVNRERKKHAAGQDFTGSSVNDLELKRDPSLSLDYIIAPPRMGYYMKYSAQIYEIYLQFVAPEDIHVYSIDEVFIDATDYLARSSMSAYEFARTIMRRILAETGITATAGIGTNLYLAKVAMDVGAKHIAPDKDGARIAELDEMSYRRTLWAHTPITDFWRVGRGYAEKLASVGLFTMGDVALCSVGKPNEFYNEDLLYRLFGVNAELLIDHAWGWEPCTIADIRAYRPQSNSIGAGQVLSVPYPFAKARLVASEMAEGLALELVKKRLVTDQIVMTVGYDVDNPDYRGETTTDRYGRTLPKHAHGTHNLAHRTQSGREIVAAVRALFDRIVNKDLQIRRMYLTATHVLPEGEAPPAFEQMSLFSLPSPEKEGRERAEAEREKRRQEAVLAIKEKYGKNAILKGMNFEEGATARERNETIGGHKA